MGLRVPARCRPSTSALLMNTALTAQQTKTIIPMTRSGAARWPTSDRNPQLFDHLGGAQHDRWGYGKAERLGGLEVHDHLEFCRKLHRKIARLLAAQNAIDIGGGTTKVVYHVGSKA